LSRFPNPGYPIAPRLLRPILSIGLPLAFVRLGDRFPLLADLDETIWTYVDQSVADILANFVITRAGRMRSVPFWRVTYFPKLTQGLQLGEIQVERSTYECLRGAFKGELPEGLPSLAKYTLDHALSTIPGFGIKTLVDLLDAVHLHEADNSMADDEGDRLDLAQLQRIIQSPRTWCHYSGKYLPHLPKTVSLEELQLSARAHSCVYGLLKQCVIRDVADLSRLTIGQIMERPNFGLKSLIELLNEIRPLVLESAATQASIPQAEVPSSVEASAPKADVADSNRLSTEDIQHIISRSRPLNLFLERRAPYVPPTTELDDMGLDVRTYNCITDLIRGAVISRPSDLSSLTIRQIMRTKNFGRQSLGNLLLSIEQLHGPNPVAGAKPVHVAPKIECPDLTQAAEKLAQSRVANRVRCNDPRVSKLCGDLLYAANNSSVYPPLDAKAGLHQVALRLATCTWNPNTTSQVVRKIALLRVKLAELMRMNLETELRSLAATYLKHRDLEIVLALWGWKGDPPRTLQSVGDTFGLTRERVRQIVSGFEKVCRRRNAFLPSLERVLRFIARRMPTVADDIEVELQARHLTFSCFRVGSVVECAKRFGQPVPFVFDESGAARIITEARSTGLTRLIATRARRAVAKYGLANTVDLREELTDTIHSGIDLQFLSHVIRAMESCEDLGRGWFWLRDLPRNHLLTIVRKVLAVAPRIHVSEMRAAIANDPRGMGFAPPKQVVLSFCHSAAECDIEDEMIVARQRQDPLQVLSDTEQVILEVFRTHGPLLSRAALEEHCFERGVKRSTSSLYTGRLAIIARYAPRVYGLRGTAFSPDDLDRASLLPEARFSDHGWTEKAEPWAAIELPTSALANGIVQLPASFRQTVSGRYALRTEDGQIVGNLVVSDRATWGLSPLFRRRGGEPGDILLLTFDLRRQEVTARLGDLAVVPEPGRLAEEVLD
jgi:DNA-directed RNA polymerase alpha subunit